MAPCHLTTATCITSSGSGATYPDLTDRERGVLQRMAQGKSNTEIAHDLHLSTKTVQNHVSRIFVKLGVVERLQAIVVARDAHLHLE